MNAVRYRPGEAIRWLETGSADVMKNARRKAESLVRREGHRTIARDVKEAAGALYDLGKGTLGDMAHRQAMAAEYVLFDDRFEVITSGRIKVVPYSEVKRIKLRGDKTLVELERGSVTIKPHAYLVAGRLKVPIGWSRDGMEVPYEVLLDELAGRCGLTVEEAE